MDWLLIHFLYSLLDCSIYADWCLAPLQRWQRCLKCRQSAPCTTYCIGTCINVHFTLKATACSWGFGDKIKRKDAENSYTKGWVWWSVCARQIRPHDWYLVYCIWFVPSVLYIDKYQIINYLEILILYIRLSYVPLILGFDFTPCVSTNVATGNASTVGSIDACCLSKCKTCLKHSFQQPL
jgi:hypothetical protein